MITFTFSGDTLSDIKRQIVSVFGPVDDKSPEVAPAPSSPPPAAEPSVTTANPEDLKAQALAMLQRVYADPTKRPAVKALAEKFGVKRLADVPLERAYELLDAASRL